MGNSRKNEYVSESGEEITESEIIKLKVGCWHINRRLVEDGYYTVEHTKRVEKWILDILVHIYGRNRPRDILHVSLWSPILTDHPNL